MSTTTDGIFFWGYCWDTENQAPWDEEDGRGQESEERYAAALGISRPAVPYSEEVLEVFQDYWHRRDAATEAAPCGAIYHCSGSCTMYGVGVKAATWTASRGYPVEVPPERLVVDPAWQGQLDDYCRKIGADPGDKKAGWHLVSYWG